MVHLQKSEWLEDQGNNSENVNATISDFRLGISRREPTFRLTLEINPILQNRVCMAKANQEFTNCAVFIDRDLAQFGLILQHLRNRSDMVSSISLSQTYWKRIKALNNSRRTRGKRGISLWKHVIFKSRNW
jgi:hypothetical protein